MRVAGYAAIFYAPDRGGDVVRKGTFGRAPATGVPLLWQHEGARRIGTVESLSEDRCGLFFGYRVHAMQRGAYRELTDLDLIEVSIVTQQMQPLARVLPMP